MNTSNLVIASLLVLSPFLLGWPHVLSPEAYFSATRNVDYSRIQADPQAYEGITLLLAGRITGRSTQGGGTTLEILCYDRDEKDRPREADPECGRFLARAPRLLEQEMFGAGRLVTLTGTVTGGAGPEGLPLFRIGEIHPWPTREEERRYRYPYYYDPFCDPFYPFGPYHRYRYGYPWHCW